MVKYGKKGEVENKMGKSLGIDGKKWDVENKAKKGQW